MFIKNIFISKFVLFQNALRFLDISTRECRFFYKFKLKNWEKLSLFKP